MDAARTWARGGPTAQDVATAALLGLTADEVVPEPLGVWPDNWPYVEAFLRLGTQWRIGMSGAVGLDYGVITPALLLMNISSDEHGEYFDALQLMERAALDEFARKRTSDHGQE